MTEIRLSFGLSEKDLLLLFGAALLVRALAAWPQQQPNYFDAAYSYVNALNLVEGRGFVEDFVWNYLGRPGPPPQPSHLYWMPLTSILAWLGMAIGGAGYRAAQIPFIILSALLAPVSYLVVRVLSGQRWQGWLAGLLVIFSGFYFPFWTAIDNFAPFGAAGSLALLAAGMGLLNSEKRGRRPDGSKLTRPKSAWLWWVGAGMLAGLAHLARADGPLLLAAMALVVLLRAVWSRRAGEQGSRGAGGQASEIGLHLVWVVGLLVVGYGLVMGPWFWRNWQVTGTFLPVSGSQTIWLTDYDDLFSYQREFSAHTFFEQGIGPIIRGRWWALTANLQTVLAVWGLIFAAPLAAIGGWQLRRQPLVQLAGLYGLLLFLAMSLVFAFPGARGGLFHSGAAVLPFICGLAAIGLDRGVDWIAARRRRWKAGAAKRVFGLGMAMMAIALSCFIYYQQVLRNNRWNMADALYPALAAWVTAQDPAATVMVGNPPAYRYHGGGLSVVIPNENLETTLQAAAAYGVDYLALDHNHPAALAELYRNPEAEPSLRLVQTFGQGTGQAIYLFEIEPGNRSVEEQGSRGAGE